MRQDIVNDLYCARMQVVMEDLSRMIRLRSSEIERAYLVETRQRLQVILNTLEIERG
jgi:hypothetical protein